MSKSIKLNNDIYLDSESVIHNKETLKDVINNSCFCIISNNNLKEECQATFNIKEINGNAFIIENNNIKIQNTKRIRISVNLSLQFQEKGNSFIMIKICKNDEIVIRNYTYSNNMELYYYDSCSIPNFELDVNKNDIIKLFISSNLKGAIHNDEWGKSYVTIEKIK